MTFLVLISDSESVETVVVVSGSFIQWSCVSTSPVHNLNLVACCRRQIMNEENNLGIS